MRTRTLRTLKAVLDKIVVLFDSFSVKTLFHKGHVLICPIVDLMNNQPLAPVQWSLQPYAVTRGGDVAHEN